MRTIFMLSKYLVCGQNLAQITDEQFSLVAEVTIVAWLYLGKRTGEKPVDESADLLLRGKLSRVESCDNRRCFVHVESRDECCGCGRGKSDN